jgi:hypothetical protein
MRQKVNRGDGSPSMLDGVLVQQTDKGTIVACVDTRGTSWLSHEMLDRLKRFAESGDLAEIGTFRYALVKKREYGAHIVTMSTGTSAPLLKMFPKTGDVPGPDHRYVPRLAGSRRVLSVSTHDLQMLAYEHSDRRLLDVITDTQKELVGKGLALRDLETAPPGAHVWVNHGAEQAVITFAERDGRVFTMINDVPL